MEVLGNLRPYTLVTSYKKTYTRNPEERKQNSRARPSTEVLSQIEADMDSDSGMAHLGRRGGIGGGRSGGQSAGIACERAGAGEGWGDAACAHLLTLDWVLE